MQLPVIRGEPTEDLLDAVYDFNDVVDEITKYIDDHQEAIVAGEKTVDQILVQYQSTLIQQFYAATGKLVTMGEHAFAEYRLKDLMAYLENADSVMIPDFEADDDDEDDEYYGDDEEEDDDEEDEEDDEPEVVISRVHVPVRFDPVEGEVDQDEDGVVENEDEAPRD